MKNGTTYARKVLAAAHKLEQAGHRPFTAEQLVVQAWQSDQAAFGLKGFAELYPDCNKVYSLIMGERGLARYGWMQKVGQKLYTLTRKGSEEVQTSCHRVLSSQALTREDEKVLELMLTSIAYRRTEETMYGMVTYADALAFWGITKSTRNVDKHLANTTELIAKARDTVYDGELKLSSGGVLRLYAITQLAVVHERLQLTFARHLDRQKLDH